MTIDTDKLIDELLSSKTQNASDGFVDRVLLAAAAERANDARLDNLADALVSKMRDFNVHNLADKALRQLESPESKFWNKIFSYGAGIAVAACAAFAIFTSSIRSTLPSGIPTATDYAIMSEISDEIDAIAYIVAQEELFDMFKM